MGNALNITLTSEAQSVLVLLSQDCAERGHDVCASPDLCSDLRGTFVRSVSQFGGLSFDSSSEVAKYIDSEPSSDWSTEALFRCFRDFALQPPWLKDPFKRAVWGTSSLARLAERGIPVDSVMRCIADDLVRRIAFEVSTAVVHEADLGRRLDVPDTLREWMDLVSTRLDLGGDVPALQDLLVEFLRGPLGAEMAFWIEAGAASHVLAWRMVGHETATILSPSDSRAVPEAAVQWLFDRSTQTYLEDWKDDSLVWEISHHRSPSKTIAACGLQSEHALQRQVQLDDVLGELGRRKTDADPDSSLGGTSTYHVVEEVAFLLKTGQFTQAQLLAKTAVREQPGSKRLQNAQAFSMIPTDPVGALELIRAYEQTPSSDVSRANELSCMVLLAQRDRVLTMLPTFAQDWDAKAWLWEPASLVAGEPVITFTSTQSWREACIDALTRRVG